MWDVFAGWLNRWGVLLFTIVIAAASVIQAVVYIGLKRIEQNREKVRLLAQFGLKIPGGPARLAFNVANLSAFGVWIERFEFSIVASYLQYTSEAPLTRSQVFLYQDVLSAYASAPERFDIQYEILNTFEGRNASFLCDVKVLVVYRDRGESRTITASIGGVAYRNGILDVASIEERIARQP